MAVRHGRAFWPGVNGFISCRYTVSHGTAPGVAHLVIPEQDTSRIARDGDLVLSDGVGGDVVLKGCRVGDVSFGTRSATGGRTITLYILDRRWAWKFGAVSGWRNVADPYPDPDSFPDGEYTANDVPFMPGTTRTAEAMMEDCLKAMGETGWRIESPPPGSGTPGVTPALESNPPARWDEEVPAAALSGVAEAIGYRVVFRPNEDITLLAPAGAGGQLPDGLPAISDSPGLALAEAPEKIRLVGGPTLFHDTLALEPVGLERDGTVKALDDLSYRPDGGWDRSFPPYFGGVNPGTGLTRDEATELAKRHVWRTFRVKMIDIETGEEGKVVVGGYHGAVIEDRKQIVLGDRLYGLTKLPTGQPSSEDPWVIGSVFLSSMQVGRNGGFDTINGNTTVSKRLPVRPAIDPGRGLVTFDQYLYRFEGADPDRTVAAPDLYLKTSFQVRSAEGLVPHKFVHPPEIGDVKPEPGVQPETVRRPELVLIVRTIRDAAKSFEAVETVDNKADDLVPAAEYYLDAARRKYETGAASTRVYAGIFPIDPDGAVQQVTWSVGGNAPATTEVSRNTEHARYLPGFAERRQKEVVTNFAAAFERADKAKAALAARSWGGGDV